MEEILLDYIKEVDGGDVKEVYAAYLRWIDENEAKTTENHERQIEKLEIEKPADYAEQKVALEKKQEQKKREFLAKREIIKGQRTWPSWYDSAKQSTTNRLDTIVALRSSSSSRIFLLESSSRACSTIPTAPSTILRRAAMIAVACWRRSIA